MLRGAGGRARARGLLWWRSTLRVLIFEGGYTGHRLSYVAEVARALRDLPVETVVAIPRAALGSSEYRAFIEPLENQVEVDAWIPGYRWKAAGAGFERCLHLRAAVARSRADHVLVPHGDGMVQVAGVLSLVGWRVAPVPVEVLVMRGAFLEHRKAFASWAKALSSRLTMTRADWALFHFIDFRLWDALTRSDGRNAARFRLMPDPVTPPVPYTRQAARGRLGLPVVGRYVTVAGLIDARKGVGELVAALRGTPDLDVTLLIAGKQTEDVREVVSSARLGAGTGPRIVSLDRFLSADELDAAIAAGDVVATVYPGHVGPASILTRALAAGRPVLGLEDGWIGEVIQRLEVGWTSPSTRPAALGSALRLAVEQNGTVVIGESAKRFLEFNSPENFRAAWTRALRRSLGMPAAPYPDTYPFTSAGPGQRPAKPPL